MLNNEYLIEISQSLKNLRPKDLRSNLFRLRREGIDLHELASALANGAETYRNEKIAYYILDKMNLKDSFIEYELAYLKAMGFGFTCNRYHELEKLKEGAIKNLVLFDYNISNPIHLNSFLNNNEFTIEHPGGLKNIDNIIEKGVLYIHSKPQRLLWSLPCLIFALLLFLALILKPITLPSSTFAVYSIIALEISIFYYQLNRIDITTINSKAQNDTIKRKVGLSILWMVIGIILFLAAYVSVINIIEVVVLFPLAFYIFNSVSYNNASDLYFIDKKYLEKYYYSDFESKILPKRFERYVNVGDGWEYKGVLQGSNLYFFSIIVTIIWSWIYLSYII